jgi:hypothetical protein
MSPCQLKKPHSKTAEIEPPYSPAASRDGTFTPRLARLCNYQFSIFNFQWSFSALRSIPVKPGQGLRQSQTALPIPTNKTLGQTRQPPAFFLLPSAFILV